MGSYLRGDINQVMDLGTLGAKVALKQVNSEVVDEKTFVSSVVAAWSLDDFTPATTVGPIAVGIAHSDYTATEIEEFLENAGGWTRGNLIATREVGRRLIRTVGVFEIPDDAADAVVLNDGLKITTKLGWTLITGQTIAFWAYNQGEAALATTSPDVHVQGHANLWSR